MIAACCFFLSVLLLSADRYLQNPVTNESTEHSNSRKESAYEILVAYTTCIITLHYVCAVNWGCAVHMGISAHRGYREYSGGYHEYTEGCSVHWRRRIMSTPKEYHDKYGKVIGKTTEFHVWKPQCTEHPPVYCTDIMQGDYTP